MDNCETHFYKVNCLKVNDVSLWLGTNFLQTTTYTKLKTIHLKHLRQSVSFLCAKKVAKKRKSGFGDSILRR